MKHNLRDIVGAVPSWTGGLSMAKPYLCTPNQERYLLASLGGTQSYYLPLTFTLPPGISASCLRRSVEHVIAETPALGALFAHSGAGRFTWRPVGTRALRLRQIRARDDMEAVADATTFVHGGPGPLTEPPCKLHIARLPTGGHLVTLALHHAVADAVSLGLVVDRISAAYSMRRQGGLFGSFATKDDDLGRHNYLALEDRADHPDQSDRTHWRHALADAAAAGPLPLLRSSPDGGATARGEASKRLNPDALRRLAAAARAAGVTTFEATFAAYLLVLARQTGRSAACATFQSSGRRAHPERENVIGVFSNALPVLAHLDPNATFADHARAVRRAVRTGLRHEALPYHEIIRETGIHPRFGINWYPGVEALNLDGLRIPADRRVGWQSDFDLNFHALQTDDELRFSLSFPVKRLHAWRAEVVLDHVVTLLTSDILSDARPISDISLPGANPAMVTSVVESVDRSGEPEPDSPLSARVAQIAEECPERTAVVAATGTLTYGALMRDVNTLAEALVARGAGPGHALAIELPRGSAMAAAILAAERVGAVFAVYDPDYPPNRRSAMDDALRPALRLRTAASGSVTACGPDRDDVDGDSHREEHHTGLSAVIDLASGALVLLDAGTAAPLAPLPNAAHYALFTSGTTGRPKCVLADGRGLCRFLERTRTDRTITADDRFALLGGLGHDPMLRDVLLPLTSGATLHVPSEDTRRDPHALFDWLAAVRPTMLHLTPQLARVLAFGARGRTLPTVRHATFGGDMLPADTVAVFRAIAPEAAISNLYGATETPQAASVYDLAPGEMDDQESGKGAALTWDICPVGRGAGSRRLVLERDGRAAATGEPAEIIIEGDDLALGYYDAADADGAVQQGRASTDLPLRHRTGDLGLRMPSGDVLVLGRADDQVKIRGFRVEPAEISRHLESRADVAQATTIVRPGANGDAELVAYAVPKADSADGTDDPLTVEMLLESCRRNLPAAMVPRAVVLLDHFPLTANGKIDRAALPDPDAVPEQDLHDVQGRDGGSQTDGNDGFDVVTPEAAALAGEVADVLGRASVSPTSCVRDLGVDSLSYLSVSLALEARLGSLPRQWDTLPLTSLAEHGTASSGDAAGGLGGVGWSRHIRMVETPVFMRAVAIAAVVAGHFGLIAFGGATSALFFIAGHSFGRFQVPAVLRQDSIAPILNLVALIAVPTVLYSLLIQTAFATPEPLTLLMLGNLLGPDVAEGMSYWFVDVLVQCLLVLVVILALPPVRRAIRERPFECACLAVSGSVMLRYAIGAVWETDPLYDRVVHEKLWLLALGWCLAQAESWRQRIFATALTLSVLGIDMVDGALRPLTAAAFIVILAVPRIPIPTIVATMMTRVAAGSLFIYLTHFQFGSVADRLPSPLNSDLAAFALALVGGVMVHLAWDRVASFARGLITRPARLFYKRSHS